MQNHLRQRHRDLINWERFHNIKDIYSTRRAVELCGHSKRPAASLHFTMFDSLRENFAVVIGDQSRRLRTPLSATSAAIRALKYHHVLFNTSTPGAISDAQRTRLVHLFARTKQPKALSVENSWIPDSLTAHLADVQQGGPPRSLHARQPAPTSS